MKSFKYSGLLLMLICFAMLSFIPVRKKKIRVTKKSSIATKHNTVIKDSIENPYYIIIYKSSYELKVFDDEGWYATYPTGGARGLDDKMREGDKLTPEGSFKIILKKIHPKWGPELLLDFPNEESIQLFNERKATGKIPKNAKIGGGISIHAARQQEDWTVDEKYNWTDGCIALKYTEMQDLYSYIPIGTPVIIRK